MFAAAQSQWLYRAFGGYPAGLSYPAAESAARGLGIDWPAVFPAIALMEREALGVFARRAEAEKKSKPSRP